MHLAVLQVPPFKILLLAVPRNHTAYNEYLYFSSQLCAYFCFSYQSGKNVIRLVKWISIATFCKHKSSGGNPIVFQRYATTEPFTHCVYVLEYFAIHLFIFYAQLQYLVSVANVRCHQEKSVYTSKSCCHTSTFVRTLTKRLTGKVGYYECSARCRCWLDLWLCWL